MRKVIIFSTLLLTLLFSPAFADVKLPHVLSDGMVLQQKSHAAFWGWADPGEKVNVKGSWDWLWGKTVTADEDGKWMVKINTPSAGGPFEVTVKGNNTIVLKDVLVGEVWLCSGQSNMEFPVKGWKNQPLNNSKEEIKNANYPKLRLFQLAKKTSFEPLYDADAQWKECSPETVADFSATAYFFGRQLQTELDIPVGLIHVSYGGSSAEAWMPKKTIEKYEDYQPILERWAPVQKQLSEIKTKYSADVAKYKKAAAKAKKEGKARPKGVRRPWQLYLWKHPYLLYNAMRLPVQPYTIKGMIWYQGECNAPRAYQYRTLFPAMIESWREEWGQGDFPFYYVQLASYLTHKPTKEVKVEKGSPAENDWAELREAQLMTLSVPNTGMASAIDIGSANCIHPGNKQDVGKRLAMWALAKDYGFKISYSGPLYKSMKVEGNKIRISFDYTDSGLKAKGDKLEGFAIAGADKKFLWADAKIDGNTVVVSNDLIVNPVAVRYAWAKCPIANLYNDADLPASPFRTDEWAGLTIDKK